MNNRKSLAEIENTLPNGFHDAFLDSITIDFPSRSASLTLQIWVGNLESENERERETYKHAVLKFYDLIYFTIDPPDQGKSYTKEKPLRIDAGDSTKNSAPPSLKPRMTIPQEAFAYWFFVEPWNAFFHIAACKADLQWT